MYYENPVPDKCYRAGYDYGANSPVVTAELPTCPDWRACFQKARNERS